MILREGTGLFRVRKPKKFNLPTRYYDPDKERFNQRVQEIHQSLEGKKEGKYVAPKELDFRAASKPVDMQWKRAEYKRSRNMANLRFIIIVGVLLVVFLFLLMNVDGAISTLFKGEE